MHRKINTLEDLLKQPIIKCFLSGLIPVVILLLIYMKFDLYPYDKMTVMNSDLNGQYVSYLAYLKNLLEDGGSFIYSFSKTLGGDMMGILTYYLLSPFNLVLLFVSLENIPYAVLLIILMKTAACGITMFLFLSAKNDYKYYNLIFSTAYALSGYMLMYQTHIMWLDGVLLLPLIALGIDRIIEKKKSALYIFSLAASIVICYYTGYMSCIFAVIYFLYRFVLCGCKGERFQRIFKFGLASLCAGGISAVILLPAVYALLSTKLSSATEVTSGLLIQFPPEELLAKFFTGAGDNEEFHTGIPFVFSGILSFALLIQSFFSGAVKVKEKVLHVVLLLIFVLSFCINTIDKIWHGFAMPNNFNHRYSFIFIFFVLFIAWRAFSVIVEERKMSLFSVLATWTSIIFLAAFLILRKYEYMSTPIILLDVAFVSIGCAFLFFYLKCDRDFSLILLAGFGMLQFVNLYINGVQLLEDRPYQDTSITGYVKEVEDTISYVQKYDTGIYRMEQDFHYSHNDAMLFSYRGLSHFSSAETYSVISFMGNLGYNQYYNYWAKYGEGATLAGDSLLGVKYLLSREEEHPFFEEFHHDATVITYYNPYALSLGFTVKRDILQKMDWQENIFENQNNIYAAMTGDNKKILYEIDAEEAAIGMQYEEGSKLWMVEENTSGSRLVYRFVATNENPVYVYLPTSGAGSALVYVNNEELTTWLGSEESGVLLLGSFEPGEAVEFVLQPESDAIGFKCIYFAYLDMSVFKEKIEKLQEASWYLYESTDTKMEAEVTAKEGEVLFLSIPYDKNWEVILDGNVVRTVEVLDNFMAVELTAGTHHIVLQYQNPTLILGLFITILCTFAAIFIIIIENRQKKRYIPDGELIRAQYK